MECVMNLTPLLIKAAVKQKMENDVLSRNVLFFFNFYSEVRMSVIHYTHIRVRMNILR